MTALWLPCTQMQTLETAPPLHIVRGQGNRLFDDNGKGYLDMISSWWVNLHGHCHPHINAKIKAQLDTLEHTLIASVTHPPILQLAQKLVDITPAPLTKAFFADSGSSAVEVAIKMSLQFWQQNAKDNKKKFISLEHGYHGETVGSLSVTDVPLFSQQYKDLIVSQIRVSSPAHIFAPDGMSAEDYENDCLAKLKTTLQNYHSEVCAIILEPLVQGATGMAMYSAQYLYGVAKLAKQYNIHVIYDEIAVGFGRTGTMFACEQLLALARDDEKFDFCPDFVCLSKGLTAGYLPMSCVMTTDRVYQAFYNEKVEKGFLHSHSFTGNPLACASALASLEIFENENILEQNQIKIACMAQQLAELENANLPIKHARQTGMIVAFTLVFEQNMGKALAQFCLNYSQDLGILIRPIGNHVYLIPPYGTTVAEFSEVFAVLKQGIEFLLKAQSTVNFSPVSDINLP